MKQLKHKTINWNSSSVRSSIKLSF